MEGDSLTTVLDRARDEDDIRRYLKSGRVAATTETKQKYWQHWKEFVRESGYRPFLDGPGDDKDGQAILGFACRVRRGSYGRGRRVRVQTVEKALAAVSEAFEMDRWHRHRNPVVIAGGNRDPKLKLLLQGMRREDPPKDCKLAVPIDVVDWLLRYFTKTAGLRHIARLCTVAFYYLLRVGEYTVTGRSDTLTQQFRLMDVTFRDGARIIPQSAPIQTLKAATSATLTINNQKNGVRNQAISHDAANDPTNPVAQLAEIVHHIRSNGGRDTDLICTYFNESKRKCHVTDKRITVAIRRAVVGTGLITQGYTVESVSSHSLRAGGATALKIAGADDLTIRKYGRWRSSTFEDYIHEQIQLFSKGWSAKMAVRQPYINVGATRVIPASAA